MSMPRVSIIMPNKNNARWLPKSIGSVINQTYRNWELIIVDDHSTDDSLEIIRSFMDQDSRIECICDPDVNYPLTKNIGFDNSSGKYVVFLDSDDWLGKEFLERGLQNIKKADAYASSFAVWFGNEKYEKFIFKKGVFTNIDALKLKFRFGNGNTLLKRRIIENHRIRFPEFRYSEDAFFYTQYLAWSKRISVDDYIGFFVNRSTSQTLTTKGIKGYHESMKVYDELLGILGHDKVEKASYLIRNNNMVYSILIYLDSSPRKYKLIYGVKHLPQFLTFIFTSEFYMKKWALATTVDLFIPVKWFLRRFRR